MTLTGPGVEKFPTLFSSYKLKNLNISNRCIVSPMTRTSATEDGLVTDQIAEYYAKYARSGWGLIITEGTYIDFRYSQGYTYQPGIADERQQESWRKVVEASHAAGTPIFMQIFHCGAINQGNYWVKGSIAPSVVKPKGEQIPRYRGAAGGFQTPREITNEEIESVIESFGEAAKRADEVGFDGIEVHGANGYLPDQFLTTYTNQREDDYGGRIENRIKFHCKIMTAVRNAVPNKPVGVRISQTKVNDFEYNWPGGTSDAQVIFSKLAETGIDFIDCSAHLGVTPIFDTKNSLSGLAKKYSGVPVISNGKLQDPIVAEKALTEGEGDFVAIGKGALADYEWPLKIAAENDPFPFDPGMITPYATLDCNEDFWTKNPDGVSTEIVEARDAGERA